MLPNEVFALECLARYAREGLDVKEGGVHDGYPDQFAHCPYPKSMGNDGHYLTFYDHQHQGLLQSVDVGRRCYFTGYALLYLNTWPSGCFELWDIYDKFNGGEYHSQFNVPIPVEVRKKISKSLSEQMTGRTGALHPRSMAIIAINPDGTEEHFGSVREAARKLEIPYSNLYYYLKPGRQPKRGKFKNYQFFYEVKE